MSMSMPVLRLRAFDGAAAVSKPVFVSSPTPELQSLDRVLSKEIIQIHRVGLARFLSGRSVRRSRRVADCVRSGRR